MRIAPTHPTPCAKGGQRCLGAVDHSSRAVAGAALGAVGALLSAVGAMPHHLPMRAGPRELSSNLSARFAQTPSRACCPVLALSEHP